MYNSIFPKGISLRDSLKGMGFPKGIWDLPKGLSKGNILQPLSMYTSIFPLGNPLGRSHIPFRESLREIPSYSQHIGHIPSIFHLPLELSGALIFKYSRIFTNPSKSNSKHSQKSDLHLFLMTFENFLSPAAGAYDARMHTHRNSQKSVLYYVE